MGRKQRNFSIQLQANSADIRLESLRGQEYVVVLVVMLVEGVIQGVLAESPELALCSEFGSNPAAWNGCPVSIGHPQVNEEYVAAGSTDIWDSVVVGFLFNTATVDGALVAEAWICKEWCANAHDDVLQALQDGEVMEVSTGLFSEVVDAVGNWNGETYRGVWTNCQPDHLALLPNNIGACSVEMGCGTNRAPSVNVNSTRMLAIQQAYSNHSKETLMSKPNKPQVKPATAACECTSQAAATVLAAAAKKTPLKPATAVVAVEPEVTTPAVVDTAGEIKLGPMQRIMQTLQATGEAELSPMEIALRDSLAGISDSDLRTALSTAIAALEPDSYVYIVAVFDDRFVYEEANMETYQWKLMQRDYTLSGDTVNLGSSILEVRPQTNFIPVSATATEPAEQETTSSMSANVEVALEVEPEVTAVVVDEAVAGSTEASTEVITPIEVVTPVEAAVSPETVNAAIAAQFNASQDEIAEALAFKAQQKTAMINKIMDNDKNTFTVAELHGLSMSYLEKFAGSIGVSSVNYAMGAGAPSPDKEETTFAPMQAFPREESKVAVNGTLVAFPVGGKKVAS